MEEHFVPISRDIRPDLVNTAYLTDPYHLRSQLSLYAAIDCYLKNNFETPSQSPRWLKRRCQLFQSCNWRIWLCKSEKLTRATGYFAGFLKSFFTLPHLAVSGIRTQIVVVDADCADLQSTTTVSLCDKFPLRSLAWRSTSRFSNRWAPSWKKKHL